MSGQAGGDDRVPWSPIPSLLRRRFVFKFFTVVVFVMLVTAGIGAYFYGTATATVEQRVEGQVESTAKLQADSLESWIDGLRHQTRTLSETPAFQNGNVDDIEFTLREKQRSMRSDVVAIHYVNVSSATVLASTAPELEGSNPTERGVPWASERRTAVDQRTNVVENVYVGDTPYDSPADGSKVLAFVSSPPRNTEHAIVVEAALASQVDEFYQTSADAHTTVHGPNGTAVYDGADGQSGGLPAGATGGNESGLAERGDAVLGYASVGNTDWTVVTHVPTASAFALRDQISQTILALVAVPMVVLGVVSVVFGRRIGRALNRLTAGAGQMADGNLEVELTRTRADEIGQLTVAFDHMRSALKAQIEEATRAREEAEVSHQEAIEMNEALERKADEYSDVMARCTAGDMTVRMDADGRHGAMDRIAEDFNEMIAELEKTTGQLKRFADEVAETGETVEQSAQSVRDASEQVAESIQEVSVDTYDQQEKLADLAAQMDALADTLDRFEERHPDRDVSDAQAQIDEASRLVSAVANVADETTARAETVAGAAEEQAAELTEVTQQANSLQKYASPLGDVLGRFKTDAEREFYFPSGPGNVGNGDDASPPDQ